MNRSRLPLVVMALAVFGGGCGDSDGSRPGGPFSSADLMAQEYLVVTVRVSADRIEPVTARLLRGPRKTNSAVQDLRVIPLAKGVETGSYAMPDPRFQRREGIGWRVLESAETLVFVPLSADIDRVEIKPVGDRKDLASIGGFFKPLPFAAEACQATTTRYEACVEIIQLLGHAIVTP